MKKQNSSRSAEQLKKHLKKWRSRVSDGNTSLAWTGRLYTVRRWIPLHFTQHPKMGTATALKPYLPLKGTHEQYVDGSDHVNAASTVWGCDALYKVPAVLDLMDENLEVNDKSYAGYEEKLTASIKESAILDPGGYNYILVTFLSERDISMAVHARVMHGCHKIYLDMAQGVKVLGRAMLGKIEETAHYEEDKLRQRFLSTIEILEDTAASPQVTSSREREQTVKTALN